MIYELKKVFSLQSCCIKVNKYFLNFNLCNAKKCQFIERKEKSCCNACYSNPITKEKKRKEEKRKHQKKKKKKKKKKLLLLMMM
ncbi:hypothetical protein D0T85_11295 [Bacteroides sp. 519]|nr:hypothetical protein [Bacteroides sp. 519]